MSTQCKQINYAYPSSDMADKYNRGKGCWFVVQGPGGYMPWPETIVTVCDTERAAIGLAHKGLNIPWGRAWLQCQHDHQVVSPNN